MTGLRKKAITGVLWTSAETIGVRLVNLITFLILARILAKEDLGLVALALVYISFLELFVNVGVTEVIVQREELSDLHKDTAFWATATLGAFAIVTSVFIAPAAAKWSGEIELEAIIYWLAIGIVPVSLSRVQQGLLLRNLDFRILAIRRIVSIGVGAAVGVSMAFMGYGVWSLVGQQLVQRFVELLTLYWVTSWYPRFRFSRAALSDLWGYASRVLSINALHFASSNADTFLIGHFFGTAALGVYVVGRRIVEVIFASLKNVISRVALSAFSRLQSDIESLFQASISVARIVSLLGFPVLALFVFFGDGITTALFGDRWSEAGLVCQIVALGLIARVSIMFAQPVLKAKGHPGAVLVATLAMVIVSIAFSVSVAGIGFYAFIAGWTSGQLVFVAIMVYFLVTILDYPIGLVVRQYYGPCAAVIVSWLLTLGLETMMIDFISGSIALTLFHSFSFLVSYCLVLPLVCFSTLKNAYSDLSVIYQSRKKSGWNKI